MLFPASSPIRGAVRSAVRSPVAVAFERVRRSWVSVALLAQLGAGIAGCASMPRGEGTFRSDPPIVFENLSISPVSVYLVDPGNEWYLGRVDPGASRLLRFPAGLSADAARRVSLIAVPLGSREFTGRSVRWNPQAIQGQMELVCDLSEFRWQMTGTRLDAFLRRR